jgi:CRP-like cAMP-binding protein
MHNFHPLLDHILQYIKPSDEETELLTSVLRVKHIKRKGFLVQPGEISKHRSYVVKGALRTYLIGADGQEHSISLAIEGGWTGDPGSFLLQEPASFFVEAIENCTLIQWSYDSEKMLLSKIPWFSIVMMERAQQIAVIIQRRVISRLTLTAEQRYEEFAKDHPAFLQRFPLYVIASYLGMTREFLSKIRNQNLSK